MSVLAIATQDPNSVAETYVRQHMRMIHPGATVGIALEPGAQAFGTGPFFTREVRREAGLVGKAKAVGSFLRAGYRAAPFPSEAAALSEFLRSSGVEVVLAEFGTTGIALRSICKRLGIRMVVNFHGYDATVLPKRADIRWAYRLLARDADAFICGSKHFSRVLQSLGFPVNKTHCIPCGVEPEEFSNAGQRHGNTVVMVGRLTAKKRPDLAIQAFAGARHVCPDLRLSIIGDGPERDVCEAAILKYGVRDAVILYGAQSHEAVKRMLSEADLFMQHSMTSPRGDQESQGISLLEAMASELPVVTTDHNGFSETVAHGKTGLLSAEGDVDAMTVNLITLARDAALRREMGRAGRQRVTESFDARQLSGRLRQILFPISQQQVGAS